jgi:menaquinone-dependent protoporphyrinogen IX oxidase
MRVAVVFFSGQKREVLRNIAKGLVHGIEAQGHHVDLMDGTMEMGKKLTIYQYIAIGTEAFGFLGKTPEKISHFLSQSGSVIGKKCFAFVIKSLFGSQRALLSLMKRMEKEGMYLTFSDILTSPLHAEVIGKKLHIEK